MDSADILAIARRILAQPTAPFHEDAVRREIRGLLADCPHVTLTEDRFGNLLAHYRRGKGTARFAFAAHMDHPAYVGREFLGGVPARYLKKKPPTRKFGAFRMWDLPACEVRAGRIRSRACDDLIGCTAIVAALRELEHTGARCSAWGLFTRAEEVGFVGAIELAKSGCLPKSVTVVSLETSSVKGGPVKIGGGPIIRVGDRTSVFDSAATALLQAAAKGAGITHQRALMQGGTCEATAYAIYGYRTAAMCVALGNYHNCGLDDRIAPEFVSLDDTLGMARLCVAAATAAAADPHRDLRTNLEKRLADHRRLFRKLAP
ncbi:MAG: M20/M25/M40 family metallo-hydrolase [Chthoniobacteraceae bacterium]